MKNGLLFFILLLGIILPSLLIANINPDSLIQAIVTESEVLQKARNYQEAINLLDVTLQNSAIIKPAKDSSIAKLFHKLGVNYYFTDVFDKAIEAASRAIELRTKSLPADHPELNNSYHLRGAIYRYTGNNPKASKDLMAAISGMENSSFLLPEIADSIIAKYSSEVGALNFKIGDFYTAFSYREKAYQYFFKKHGLFNEEVAYLVGRKAVLYRYLGKPQLAISYFKKAFQIYEAIGTEAINEDLAILFNNTGFAYQAIDQNQEALSYFNQSLDIYKTLKEEKDIAILYANLISINLKLNNIPAAIEAFEKGLASAKSVFKTDYHPIIAELNLYRGQVALALKNNDEALAYFNAAIKALVPEYDPQKENAPPSPTQFFISNKRDLIAPLHFKSKFLYDRYLQNGQITDLQNALDHYLVLDTLTTKIRQGFFAGESKFLLNEKLTPIYEGAIGAALVMKEQSNDDKYLELAYSFAAKNKAVILLEGLQNESAKIRSGIPADLLTEEETLEEQYYVLERKLYEYRQGNKDSLYEATKNALFVLRRKNERLIRQLEQDYPAYYQLKYAPLSQLTLVDIQKNISPETAVIEFFVGNQHLYLFSITSNSVQYYTIDKPKDFEDFCLRFRAALADNSGNPQLIEDYLETAPQLYNWLLRTPLNDLGNNITNLVFIPDDILLQIAFEALLTEAATDWRGTSVPFLLKEYGISYTYSNRLLFNPISNERVGQAIKSFGGFGLEYDQYTLDGLSELDTTSTNRGLTYAFRSIGKLIYSDDEVIEIAQLLNGKSWVNQEATKTTFLNQANNYRMLHLAMHGIVDEDNPMSSALIFSRTTDSLDNILYASDIYNLKLSHNELVVLSACNTGYGKILRGEGIRSLVRAFTHAGSPSVVATLWSAPDKSTKDIMVNFYKHLKKGLSKDQALREAKLEYIQNSTKEYSAPGYWAHLIVAGDTGAMDIRSGNRKYWIGGILGLGLILAGLLFFRFR